MKTSYYDKVKNNLEIRQQLICVSVTKPNNLWYIPEFTELAPSYKLLRDFHDNKETEDGYIRRYKEQLARLNPQTIYNNMLEKTRGKEPIILCYCRPTDFCHRHILAEWFENSLGLKVREIGKEDFERQKGRLVKDEKQGVLF